MENYFDDLEKTENQLEKSDSQKGDAEKEDSALELENSKEYFNDEFLTNKTREID